MEHGTWNMEHGHGHGTWTWHVEHGDGGWRWRWKMEHGHRATPSGRTGRQRAAHRPHDGRDGRTDEPQLPLAACLVELRAQ
eukprot:6724485-Prymnesium_polylepis.1